MQLYELRTQKRLTQAELSKISGVPQSKISEYEKGKVEPGIGAAQKLAIALGVTLGQHLYEVICLAPVAQQNEISGIYRVSSCG